MKKSILILTSIILVATSCQKTLDIDINDADKKIVINGILYPDSIIKVNISRSLGVLEEDSLEFQFLNKATAKLYENDNYIETLVFDSMGFYHSTTIPNASKSYKLEVESEGIEKAVGRIDFIEPVPFTISDVEYSVKDSIIKITDYFDWEDTDYQDTAFQYVTINCKFNFNEPENDDNYYVIEAYSFTCDFTSSSYYNGNNNTEISYFKIKDNKMKRLNMSLPEIGITYDVHNNYIKTENSVSWSGHYPVLKDDFFNGESLNIDCEISFMTFDLQQPIYIKMYSVPKNFVNYLESLNKYWQANGNPFAQPVNVFSNIENGFGILAAFGLHQQVITLN